MNEISKTFCALPWVHLAINTRGVYRLCCNQSFLPQDIEMGDHIEGQHADKVSVEEMWNSDAYRNVRLKMLKGERLGPCGKCYREEEMGIKSARVMQNEEYMSKIQYINPEGLCSVDSIKYIDVRLGNKCNLSCRMCNPFSSDQWIDIEEKTNIRGTDKKELDACKSLNWFEKKFFWDNLLSSMDSCEILYFSGGEPMLFADQQTKLFDKCIEKDISKNILLRYNTNLTIPITKFEKYWKHFRHIRINCSIDGFDKVNEYIRYPSKWSNVEKNFLAVCNASKTSQVSMNVMATVQMYNIFDLVNLFDYLKQYNLFPLLNLLNHPDHYNIRVLSQKQKDKVTNLLMEWYEQNKDWLSENDNRLKTYEKLPKLIDYMNKKDWSHLYPEFLKETKVLDKMRNQRAKDYVSEVIY